MVVAAVAGLVFSASGAAMPVLVEVTASMLGQAAPPMILLAFGISLFRCFSMPVDGFFIILLNSNPIVVHPAELILSLSQPLFRCFEIPFCSLFMIFCKA